ncbi:MAG TPA: hypothetical protein VGM77_02910 [Gemmatimonadales bacterium]|jgi:hypothetical protein
MIDESTSGIRTISEFLELHPIARRKFLVGMQAVLVGLSGLNLAGCGAGSAAESGTPPPPPPPPASGGPGSGTIVFPTGFAPKLTGLTVTSGHGVVTVDSAMGFGATTDPSNPSMVYLQDATGAVIFLGFVDPASTSNTLGALSTAIALIYFALDAYSLPPANNAAILALIAADPHTTTLANAISQRMLASTYALDRSDSAITAALATAYAGITGAALSGRRVAPVTTAALESGGTELAISGGLQSGFNINVDPTGATTSYTGQNTFRRYATMYAYQTGSTDTSGTKTTLTKALLTGTPIDVDSTQRLNFITALKDIFSMTAPLTPVTSDAVTLSLPSGTTQATFDIIVLGSSGAADPPAFFSQAAYSGEHARWESQVARLNLRTSVGDLFLGLILNMIGVASIQAHAVAIDAAVASLEAIGDAAWEASIQAAAAGTNMMAPVNYAARILLLNAGFPETSSAWAHQVFKTVTALGEAAGDASVAAIAEATFTTNLAIGLRLIAGAISGASIVLGVGDLAAVIYDVLHAQQGDVWSAILGVLPFHVSPTSVNITPGSSTPQQFTVSLPPGATGNFVWTWTLTGGSTAQITDEEGHQGTVLSKIGSMSVFLLTTSNDVHPMTLTVEGFFVESGGNTDSLGTAVAAIAVTVPNAFAVRTWTVSVDDDNFSDPTATDQFATVEGFFTFPVTPGATNYQIVTPQENVYNLAADSIAALPLATDVLDFPATTVLGYGAPWGQFVQLGNGMIGLNMNYAFFPGPNTLYVSPDGIQVTASGQANVFWRYYTRMGQNYYVPNGTGPISATVIADTLVYMQTIMLNEIIKVGPPILTVT